MLQKTIKENKKLHWRENIEQSAGPTHWLKDSLQHDVPELSY